MISSIDALTGVTVVIAVASESVLGRAVSVVKNDSLSGAVAIETTVTAVTTITLVWLLVL